MAETQTPEPQPTVTVKLKTVRWVTAALALVLVGVIGQTAIPSQAAEKPQTPKVTQSKKPVGPCAAKKGQEPVPPKQQALCVVVAAQAAYSYKQTGTPKGTVVVAECREMALDEHREFGRKAGQQYVVRCLVNEHEMWWTAQPKK